ncbi:glycosyltransferase [Acidicapsa ligni]|uniref:glycosyltransferase n=1 Tax=Acidicapsa ligni TaxID=542300 RepID=UPI0021E0C36D|nr:glycosyltransferase [Acidicapsa ligni]
MGSPSISVVMSVFNAERFLREAIESILEQSFRDFEFIIIDDGSTDGSSSIIESYRSSDPRLYVHRQENRGLIESLNLGCGLARGKYIARMDADDIAIRERFHLQIDFMEAHPEVGVVGGVVEIIDAKGKLARDQSTVPLDNSDIQRELLEHSVLWHPTVLMRKSTFVSVGGYRKITDAEDFDLWLRIAEQSHLANLPEVLLKYRIHPTQISATKCGKQVLGAIAALNSAMLRRRGSPEPFDFNQAITPASLIASGVSEKTLHTTMARSYLTWIRNMYRAGEYSAAIHMFEILRSARCDRAESWIIADSNLWAARAYWHEKKYLLSIIHVGHALIARPVMLGRPLKKMLAWLKMRPRTTVHVSGNSIQ